ncbi:MAG: ATP-binding protein [Bdellovibrionota bacterium]
MFHQSQRQSEENRLRGLVYSFISSMNVDKNGEVEVVLPEVISDDQDIVVAVLDGNQKQVWRKGQVDIPRTIPEIGQWDYRHLRKQNHASRLAFGMEWEGDNEKKWKYTLVIRDSGKIYRDAMDAFRKNLWTWLSIGCLTLLTLQLLLLRLGFKPLKQIADEVFEIEQGKQHKFEHEYPSELSPLTTNINSLLRHERGRQMRYQQSLDNLAHALKTPLTAMMNLSQQKEIDASLSKELSEQIVRAKDIVDYQLKKAGTVGKSPFAKPIAIRGIVEKISRSIQKVYAHKNLDIQMQMDDEVTVTMDEGDLFEVIGNIMENAAKYGTSKIHVRMSGNELTVEDDGPGFNEEKIQSIVQRGVRQDQRTEGSGIGLSVAYEIISVFGGSMELAKSHSLGGALVRIQF